MSQEAQFRRGQHLLFAAFALLIIAAISLASWRLVELVGASWPYGKADLLLYRTVPLLGVSAIACLAFVAFDTRSNIRLIGPSWWKIGWEPWAIAALMISWYIAAPLYAPKDTIAEVAHDYLSFVHDDVTGIQWSWLVLIHAAVFAAAI